MGLGMNSLFIVCLLASIYSSNGCTMQDVTVWALPIERTIQDYHEGVFLQLTYSGISSYTLTSTTDLNGGPYFSISMENGLFTISTNEEYQNYEENETVQLVTLTFSFTCTAGNAPTATLTVQIIINDNNNNPPLWKTQDTIASADTTYEFTIAPPVAPGFLVTNCISDIIVRDIDLTTYRIDFSIENNPYFEIAYDEASSTVDKEFKAVIRTTTFIRSFPEPIVLTISATDVDATGDDPITRSTTVTIYGNSEFELPVEPVFTQPFYLAQYTGNNQIIPTQSVSLQQGYDGQVQFSLAGDYAEDHFAITPNGNQVVLSVTNALPTETLQLGQDIHLVVNAAREYTSGASATVVVQLPEVVNLEFERPHYGGMIVDNTLHLTPLILSQGYQGSTVTAAVEDYPSFFTASVAGNIITVSMTPLDDNIIQENNFINLRVTASTDSSSTTAIVTLEIVKDDVATPVFGESLYEGTYDSVSGLTVAPFLLVQGYDETVTVTFSGEHESYFELIRNGASSTLRVTGEGLPSHILRESHLILSVQATKPRTVGATAVVSITLPGARELQFEAHSYKGSLQDNILTLDSIILNVGYDEDVTFSLSGDYSSSFGVSNVQNQVTITLPTQLPQEVISENNFLMLTLTASSPNGLPTTAAVLLEIIKDDVTTPVFSQSIYYGNHLGSLDIEIGNMNLVQGYDDSVTFRIAGENSEYFDIAQNQNSVTLTVRSSIPEEVIFNEKVFVFNIFADKPLTVGANAAISIKFHEDLIVPTVMQFGDNTYTGVVENKLLTLGNIVLETGFADGTQFLLSGDFASFFTHPNAANIVSLSMPNGLPAEVLENNQFIVLELEAHRERAVSAFTSIIIEIIEEEIVVPVFGQAYYTGMYTEENTLQFLETITLQQGYDETVTFRLEGESAAWFDVNQNGNSASIVSTSPVPQDILDSHHQLLFTVVANKPNTINGHAAISIDLPNEVLEQEVLRFSQSSYEGQLDGSVMQIPTITLSNEITENVLVSLSGAYGTYFTATLETNIVRVALTTDLPADVISDNEFIVIDVVASRPDAISGYTALVLSIVKEPPITTPVFEQAYYTGEISEQGALVFDHTIRLIQGYDESVLFTLEGDESDRFILTPTGENSLTLSVAEGGIEQIETNGHLVFTVVASKTDSVSGEAAIVIYNTDFTDAVVLGFERSSYLGAINNNELSIEPIVLNEGFSDAVTFTLHGELSSYFNLQQQASTINIVLQSAIPEPSLPFNGIVMLDVRASAPQAISATTTVVIEAERAVAREELIFDATHYIGQYSETNGLEFDAVISLAEGFDHDVEFSLDGDHAQWFGLQVQGNSVTLTMTGAIPPAILVNNHQLVFGVTAQKPNMNTARAAIVISLVEDFTDAVVLGFERSSYLGAINNNELSIEPIVLNEGFSNAVTFILHGELSSYFSLQQQASTVNIVLQSVIPEQSLPSNGIVMLDVRASAPQAIPATTTVVIEAERAVAREELVFSAAHYVGQYSEIDGLEFDAVISLSEGFDDDVEFSLDGDHAQWFGLQVQGNSVTLTMTGAIPPAILVNNNQLVFGVTAQKPNTITARAAIVISLVEEFTDAVVLGFEQSSYLGAINNNELRIEPIVLNEGFPNAVTFTLHGELSSYFSLQQQASTVNIVLQSAIPEQSLPSNGIVMLDVRASAPQAIPATTTVVIEAERAVAREELVFSAAHYIGQYSEIDGLEFDAVISLSEGFDDDVEFSLDGDHAQWFGLQVQGNSVTLTMTGAIPPAILVNNNQLVFGVTAQKPNTITARAAIVISLVEEFTDAVVLGFEQSSYLGAINNNELRIEPIVLNEGFSNAVTFTLHGELSSYFSLQQQASTVNIVLQSAIPEQSLPSNGIVMLDVRASAPQAIPATTTVVIEAERAVAREELVFSAAHYIGQYSEIDGLEFDAVISLSEGFDDDVEFSLDEDHAQWFGLQVQGNSVTLTMTGAIPPAILVNNNQLVFGVTAQKPNTITARAAIVISLVEEFTDAVGLGFEQSSYLGAINNNELRIEPIVLNEGFSNAVTFTLHGELSSYFSLQQQASTVNIVLQSAIPEQSLPSNGIVMLDVRASAPQAIPATTTVVIEAERAVAREELVFSAAHYIGQYSEIDGLEFDAVISLSEGFDDDVEFSLDGDHAQWFGLQVQGNSVTLTMTGAIPPEILVNNHQLVFGVTAQKPNTITARAAIVISLVEDFTDAVVLGFERSSYLGAINNNELSIEPIVLNEGFSNAVTFTLHGELSSYFSLQQQASTVNIVLQSAIPEQSLPSNGIVMLDVRASAPQAIPATTTVVIEAERAVAREELIFDATHYIGQYSETNGLEFDAVISLAEGFDHDVEFSLDGDHAQWFGLQVQGNSVTLTMTGAIPPAILVNNHQLVFGVTAQKPNMNTARAAIVISLVEDFTDAVVLGFEQSSYLGAITNNELSIEPIVLNEGFSNAVTFILHGELSSYFSLQQQASTVNIVLQSVIPEQLLPSNGIVMLDVRASAPQAIPATTTVVIEAERAVAREELVFSAAHYVGQYSEIDGLEFDAVISLSEGFDDDVEFSLDGDHAQWFGLQVQGNSVTLTMTGAIPPAILVNNNQLVFGVTAQKPNTITARAAIVISLVEEFTDAVVLGFEQSSYLGAINNNELRIEPIVLNEGFSNAVTFTLHGELSSYFSLQQQASTVNIVLQSAIPEQSLPSNGIVMLDVRASAPQAIPATTTVVIEAERAVAREELVFSAAHYIGQYSEIDGLEFDAVISLSEGFDDDVEFSLDGDHAQWFGLQVQGNSVTLTMTGAIPPAILVNNHQLVFGVTAQKPNTITARAAIVISLVEDFTDAVVLGFERSSYLGAINNNELSIEPIVLNEGFSNAVTFTLHGELSSYFSLQQQASTVNIVLQSAIPEQSLPSNGIVMLDVRASAPQAIPATTTVVIEAERAVAREELIFDATHYIGQYSETNGLEFDAVISLAEGFDHDVEFSLDGDHAQWFGLQVQGNSVTLTMTGAIPPAILVNNHQLVFGVTAQKPNMNTARAAIVISLVEDFTDAVVLGFEQSSYLGAITNNELSIEPIVLNEGFSNAVTFTIHGEISSYFSLQQQASTVNIVLQSAIPEQSLPSNGIVMLDVRASAPQAIPATTTVVIEAERAVAREELIFDATHYIGQYSETNGLEFDAVISLAEGFDDDVEFSLDGDHAQWFGLQVQGNSVTLTMTGAIPPAILVNNHQLVFSVTAQKPNTITARAAIVISLVEDFTDAVVLGFEQSSYLGAVNNNELSIEPIVLNEGFSNAVTFTIHGELSSYFSLQQQASTVNIVLQSAIPDQSLPSNGIVMLDVRASAPQAIPATTTVVIEAERAVAREELIFDATHYIGQYSETNGLEFDAVISLAEGFDDDVEFFLDGDHAQWFGLQVQGNSVTLTMTGAIPPAILVNNHQLVFGVTAQKPNTNTARAAIVISLVEDFTDAVVLGFEQSSYLGAITNNELSIEPIVLNEGFSNAVTFTIHGEISSYFSLQQQASTVNIVLQSAIPEQSLPSNGIVMLDVRASAPQAIPATTTVVIEAERAVAREELIFDATHYIGQYSETNGLEFDAVISLAEGFDDDVEFSLDGDHAQWFGLQVQGNSVTLTMTGAIPPAILVNNHQLVFGVTAQKPNTITARAAIVISLMEDFTDAVVLGFEQSSYLGAINNNELRIEPIVLNEGFSNAVTFTIHGELSSYFYLQQQASTVNIVLQSAIPEQSLPSNGIVMLDVRASAPQAIPSTTTIVIEAERAVVREELVFSAAHYIGQYSEIDGLDFDAVISLAEGFDNDVEFYLEGDHAQWFGLQVQGNSVTLTMTGAIPPAILVNNHQLVFSVTAQKPNTITARAAIVISLVEDFTDAVVLGFEQSSYLGAINNNELSIEPIVLNEGFSNAVTFTIHGELSSYFSLQQQASTVNIVLQSAIPDQSLPSNGIVMLDVRASAPQAIPATTTVVIEAERAVAREELIFDATHYIGQYSETNGLEFDAVISLAEGFDDDVEFSLDGDHAQWFGLQVQGNSVTLTMTGAIPPAILMNNHQLVFGVTAQKPNTNTARAAIVISLVEDFTDAVVLGFEQSSYLGAINNNELSIEPIVLNEGFSNAVTFTIHGELSSYFSLQQQASTVNIVLQSAIPEQSLPSNGIVMLDVRASAPQAIPATTTVVIEAERAVAREELIFDATHYIGQYSETNGLEFDAVISLAEGFDDDVEFSLDGDHAQWFGLQVQGNSVTLTMTGAIPPAILVNNHQLVFDVTAQKPNSNTARSAIVISLVEDSGSLPNESFDKVLYEGTINLNVVQHEPITITGFTGSNIEIFGVYRDLFSATVSDGTVEVDASGTLSLPEDTTHVALELRAGDANAVLILNVIQSETPELPTVTFGSPSYVLRADMAQTGLVGQVHATASNGETVAYSLAVDNDHLQERVSVNSNGEIHLSAPTNTGIYSFQVIATSIITQVQATATVQLTVEVTATCGDDHTLPPLIILDRDEEEPHSDLVVLDSEAQEGCQFRLTNRWPLDQDWLYVDDTGLHARIIDREDPRIAFMALSQVRVELVLECASDAQSRVKRSTSSSRLDWLGPYEYGNNKWILTDTILYNSRRSFVNLIVNDINDNSPIFVGKENEPVVCGYPIPELEEIILPRALAELKATDADVGENAALSFWSSADVLAVSPTTGSVHVRDGASLTHDQLLTVSVTDLNGREGGLTGTIQLMVKLVDTSNIAVVTVRNAFLDQEETILHNLSSAVGYEVKVLSSAVISDDPADSQNARAKRDVTGQGASLQLYVYGVIDREPVAVDRLTDDIIEHELTGVDVTSTVSLEDYLEGREIYGGSGHDTGLLVATIVLSVLLFILIVAIAIWFFLRWRKARNYEQFSDANSMASRTEILEEAPKLDTLTKPRLNIDELKRSERRLQEMLDAPVESESNVTKATTSLADSAEAFDTIINIAPTDTTLPIVIQSIDKLKDDLNSGDEDEFGERKKDRRKSVVTFNENVEKIIHVEDIPDDNSSEVEVFKF